MPVICFQNLYFAWIGCLSPSPSKTKSHNAEFIEKVICSEEISLFYTPWKNAYLGFLPLSFHPSCLSIRALAGGKVCSYSLKSLHARQLLPRQCQHWHKSASDKTVSRVTVPPSRWAVGAISFGCWIFSCSCNRILPEPCHILAWRGEQSSTEAL